MPDDTFLAVVKIECESEGRASVGSGFFVNARGQVATCRHVVKNAREPISVIPAFGSSRPWKYRILYESVPDDLAILGPVADYATCGDTPFAALRPVQPGEKPPIGEQVLVLGFASRDHFDWPPAMPCTITASSEKHARLGLSGSIHPGDSGGPIVGNDHRVIGLASVKEKIEGRAMVVPTSLLIRFLEEKGIKYHTSTPSEAAPGRVAALPIPPRPYMPHPYSLLDVDAFIGRADELAFLILQRQVPPS